MRKIFIAAMATMCICCHNGSRVTQNLECKSVIDSVFMNPVLQDTLRAFISAIDSFPNPYGDESIYHIFITKQKGDTSVNFFAYGCVPFHMPAGDDTVKIAGACKYKDKVISVAYNDFAGLPTFVNGDVLDKDLYIRYEYRTRILTCDWDVLPSIREYRFANNKLELVSQRKSKYEK